MARNVFISFRFCDGHKYKDDLSKRFDQDEDTVDYSEDEDRSDMSDETIRKYLYKKLKRSSVTIVLLTPKALDHQKNKSGKYDDWMYDEIRYSLENRENNRPNGLIAVYIPEVADRLITPQPNGTIMISNVDNLFRKNMMNVKGIYKQHRETGVFDANYDSYCSLISYEDFIKNIGWYIDIASEKRDNIQKYDIMKRM